MSHFTQYFGLSGVISRKPGFLVKSVIISLIFGLSPISGDALAGKRYSGPLPPEPNPDPYVNHTDLTSDAYPAAIDIPPMPAKHPTRYTYDGDGEAERYSYAKEYRPEQRKRPKRHYQEIEAEAEFEAEPEPEYKADYTEREPLPRHAVRETDGEHYTGHLRADDYTKGFGRLFPIDSNGEAGLRPQEASIRDLDALGRAMVEEGPADDSYGDSEMPAGYTFLGQFIDHDITFDTTTRLEASIRGDHELENARTPELDLDSVYGGGPARTPYFYRLPYLRVGRPVEGPDRTLRYDLPRTKNAHYFGPTGGKAVAIIGDPRNDENIIIAQLHSAFIAFHNRTADILVERRFGKEREYYCKGSDCHTYELADNLPDKDKVKIFEEARDHVLHYYHRIIAEDYLPRVIGPLHTAEILKNGRDFFYPRGFHKVNGRLPDPQIPVEFAVAVFRYGHSQVRENYQFRDDFKANLFRDRNGRGVTSFAPLTERFVIDWRYFFDVTAETPYHFNYARRLDPLLARPLHGLGGFGAVAPHEVTSLAARNLMRGLSLHLPSGQDVAEVILPALQQRGLLGNHYKKDYGRGSGRDEIWHSYLLDGDERAKRFLGDSDLPLNYYILQEASIFGSATGLRALPGRRAFENVHYNGNEYDENEGDEPSQRDLYREASLDQDYSRHSLREHRGPRRDPLDGGNRLGPVGGTIVGEVLIGLMEHYQVKTGKGLSYRPLLQGSSSLLSDPYGDRDGEQRYLMRNLLIDAGLVETY